ncbi:Metabotropic glutamate receptor 3 [Phlyctochytrium bullatum]|nr:Metabotropic glutamate receptor 3 [Phlyctochytrium bullatum]
MAKRSSLSVLAFALVLSITSQAAVIQFPAAEVLQLGYGCGGPCQTHYRWLLAQHQARNPTKNYIEFYSNVLTTGDYTAQLSSMRILPDVFATLPAPVRQARLLADNAAFRDSLFPKVTRIFVHQDRDTSRIVYASLETTVGKTVFGATIALMALYAGVAVLFLFFYNHKVMKAATSIAMVMIVVGCLIACSALYFMVQQPTLLTCNARHWLLSIGFGLVWGNILAKGFRIFRVFNNTSGRSIVISNFSILLQSGAIVLVEVVLSLIYTFYKGPKPVLRSGQTQHEWTCQTEDSTVEMGLLGAFIAYNAILVILGIIIAALTRKVHSDYNESQLLGYSTFTFAIATLVTIPLFAVPGLDYSAKFVLLAGIIFLLTGIIMAVFCGSKVQNLLKEVGVITSQMNSSLDYTAVSPTVLKGNSQKESKLGEARAGSHTFLKLFCRPPGVASRWVEAGFFRIPQQDFLIVTNMENGNVLTSGKLTEFAMINVSNRDSNSKGAPLWSGILQSPGKKSLKVQADDEETLRSLLATTEENRGRGASFAAKNSHTSSSTRNQVTSQ